VEVDLNLKEWRAERRLVLRMEAEASAGHTDSAGEFVVEPQLPALPAITAKPSATDEGSRMLERHQLRDPEPLV
jgi:hypothetical protein